MTALPPIQPGQTPTLRLHPAANVARAAYGGPSSPAQPAAKPLAATPVTRSADSVARIGTASRTDVATPAPTPALPVSPTDHSARLTGAQVSTQIDFDGVANGSAAEASSAQPATPGVYAMYRHPADKIAAATDLTASRAASLGMGESIDVSG